MGLGSLFGGEQETQTKVEPWKPSADAAKWAFGEGRNLYDKSQANLQGFNEQNARYFKALESQNKGASFLNKWQRPMLNAARFTAEGRNLYDYTPEQYTGSQRYTQGQYQANPFLDQTIEATTRDMRNSLVRDALPGANSGAIAAGAYGGDANALMKAALAGEYAGKVGDVSAQMRTADYQDWANRDYSGFEQDQARQQSAFENDQQRQLALRNQTYAEQQNAQSMLPMMAQQLNMPAQMRTNVAAARQQAKLDPMSAMWQPFQMYSQTASPWTSVGAGAGTTTQSSSQGGGLMKGLMGTALSAGMMAGGMGYGPMAGMMLGGAGGGAGGGGAQQGLGQLAMGMMR